MSLRSRPSSLLLPSILLGFVFLSPLAHAQRARVGKAWFPDQKYGYRFKYPQDWSITPVQPSEQRLGIIAQMDGPEVPTKMPGNKVYDTPISMMIFAFGQEEAVTREENEGAGGLKNLVEKEDAGRTRIDDVLPNFAVGGNKLLELKRTLDQDLTVKKVPATHKRFTAFNGNYDITFDTWTFHLDDDDICLVFYAPNQHVKKWGKVFQGSAKTFQLIDKVASATIEGTGYDAILSKAREEAARTPGWRVLETPSKRYIIKTSSTDKRFLAKLIDRLEHSRDLYERDFPPEKPITAVSIVRVCSNLEEFHKYGKTGGGVAGWFNPSTTELVLVDFKAYDRNLTYGIASHEGFHQYCHFLFDQSEAHRWFDEGHGDYYSAFEFKGKKAIVHANMKGESRLVGIRDLIRTGQYKPLSVHLYANHQQWQNQGPTGVSPYEESWSIIYMLRQGMLGKVPKRVWRPEYADIIPNYVRVLHEGFLKAYDEYREQAVARAKADGKELDPKSVHVASYMLDPDRKKEIWDAAMAASWGQVDLEQFEENWKTYVMKYLKD